MGLAASRGSRLYSCPTSPSFHRNACAGEKRCSEVDRSGVSHNSAVGGSKIRRDSVDGDAGSQKGEGSAEFQARCRTLSRHSNSYYCAHRARARPVNSSDSRPSGGSDSVCGRCANRPLSPGCCCRVAVYVARAYRCAIQASQDRVVSESRCRSAGY